MTVWTVGHSTRPIDELVGLLREAAITDLVDVRRFPTSRRYPHFSAPALSAALGTAGIRYRHEVDLGGRRDPRPDSPNTGWRNPAFRGYADHMATPGFQAALRRVIALAQAGRPALMCAEAAPARCHRQLIADALAAQGLEVVHVVGAGQSRPHVLTQGGRVTEGGVLVYGPPRLPI